jgi:hypothetical protein
MTFPFVNQRTYQLTQCLEGFPLIDYLTDAADFARVRGGIVADEVYSAFIAVTSQGFNGFRHSGNFARRAIRLMLMFIYFNEDDRIAPMQHQIMIRVRWFPFASFESAAFN